MSKTVEMQVEKSRNLIQGLRKHLSEGGKGTSQQDIAAMEQQIAALSAASDECERLRAELAPKVKHMNELLTQVKESFVERKLIIKNCYPQELWAAYGLADKR